MTGFFNGFLGIGSSAAQRQQQAQTRREREIISDLGPRAGLRRLRDEFPGQYDSKTIADVDHTGPDE